MSTDHAEPGEHAEAHDDGHGGAGLGPVDLRMWGAGLLGTVLGLAGAITFAVATGRFG